VSRGGTTSVPVPTFVSPCNTRAYERRNQRDTSNYIDSSVALDLTFLRVTRGNAGRNVKSATLAADWGVASNSGRLISYCGLTTTLQSSKVGASKGAKGTCRGSWEMYILAFVRGILNSLMDRYRPELHYMRGPGPKWIARHGGSSR